MHKTLKRVLKSVFGMFPHDADSQQDEELEAFDKAWAETGWTTEETAKADKVTKILGLLILGLTFAVLIGGFVPR